MSVRIKRISVVPRWLQSAAAICSYMRFIYFPGYRKNLPAPCRVFKQYEQEIDK